MVEGPRLESELCGSVAKRVVSMQDRLLYIAASMYQLRTPAFLEIDAERTHTFRTSCGNWLRQCASPDPLDRSGASPLDLTHVAECVMAFGRSLTRPMHGMRAFLVLRSASYAMLEDEGLIHRACRSCSEGQRLLPETG